MAEAENVKDANVSQLMEDLAVVSKWHSLGTHLGLEASQLDVIEQEIPTGVDAIERRKGRVLDTWVRGKAGDPSWRDVASALIKMGEHSVAEEMRRKYTGSVPTKPVVSKVVVIAKENRQQIQGEFAELQMLVCEKLQTMQINMHKFLSFVKKLFQCADFVPDSEKIDDIFDAITRNGLWDFLNYRPLRQIVKKFAKDDEEINIGIQNYGCALSGYLTATKVADYIASMSPISGERVTPCSRIDERYFDKLKIKLDEKVTEKTLDYLIELWDSVSEYLLLPSLTYLLDEIHEGCISVTWLVPPIVIPAIVLKMDDTDTAKFFSKLGIIRMEVDDLCLYEEQEPSVKTATEQKQEQFPDSQEKEASQDVPKETTELEQDSSCMELPQHTDREEGSGWKERQLDALEHIISIEKKIRKRTEEKNEELRANIAYKEVKIKQLKDTITRLECKLSQTQEEAQQLQEQTKFSVMSKDVQGIVRGKCNSCECEVYYPPSDGKGLRCEYCDHVPGCHVHIIELGACNKCGEDICDKYVPEKPTSYSECQYCGCEASHHKGAEAHFLQVEQLPTLTEGDEAINSSQPSSTSITGLPADKGTFEVRLLRDQVKGLGFSIGNTKGKLNGNTEIGVVIDRIVKGGPAQMDGKLKIGDIIMAVNGQSLARLSHQQAAEILKGASDIVTLTVHSRRGSEDEVSVSKEEVTEVTIESSSPEPVSPSLITPSLSPLPTERLNITLIKGDENTFGFSIKDVGGIGPMVSKVREGQIAEGKLSVGDVIVAVNGYESSQYNKILARIRNTGDTMRLVVLRAPPAPSTLPIAGLPDGTTFDVEIEKKEGALGLRIAGGKERPECFIYVKAIFEGSPAALCGQLQLGDILLQVNYESLVEKTHREAADVLIHSEDKLSFTAHRPFEPNWRVLKRANAGVDVGHALSITSITSDSSTSGPLQLTTPISETQPESPTSPDKMADLDSAFQPQTDTSDHAPRIGATKEDDELEPVSEEVVEMRVEHAPPLPELPPPGDDEEEKGVETLIPSSVLEPLEVHSEASLPSKEKEGENEEGEEKLETHSTLHLEEEAKENVLKREYITISLMKDQQMLGFRIDRSRSELEGHGVFVHSIVGDPARSDGRLKPGDKVAEVNGKSLVGLKYHNALKILMETIGKVKLTIIREREGSEDEEQEEEKEEEKEEEEEEKEEEVEEEEEKTTPSVPPELQCKLPGCKREKYKEKDGKRHDFCGKRHALEFTRSNQQEVVPQDQKCKNPACNMQRRAMDDGQGFYDHCSLTCYNSGAQLALHPSYSMPGFGTCLLPGCSRPKYVDPANNRTHDYCGRTHAAEAQRRGIPAGGGMECRIERSSGSQLSSITAHFQTKWAKGPCPPVTCVFAVKNSMLEQRFQSYKQTLTSQAIEKHFHGTKLTCTISAQSTLCTDSNCGVCGISKNGLDRRCIRKNINYQRYGHGFYLAPNSSKCHDYTQGSGGYRAMLLFDVAPGGDSVLNYDELVVYNPDSVVPRYIIVYQKDGTGKIAK